MMLTGENRSKEEKWCKNADRGKPSDYGEMVKWYWHGRTERGQRNDGLILVKKNWVGMEKWWNGTERGNRNTRENPLRASVSATNLTCIDFIFHPHPRSERPTTNRLCHGRPSLLVYVPKLGAKLRSSIGSHCISQNVLHFMSLETKTYFTYKLR